jgi:spore coat protein CotH
MLALMANFQGMNAQDEFYDINTIQEIEISFYQSNWDYVLDTMKTGSGNYLMARWVKINGVQFDSAGVKYKGSSSYDASFAKNPLHISLDEFKNQSYQGIASIKLANFYGDPSMIREPLAYSILAGYMDCSRSNFATVTINSTFMGLYSNDESVNKKFCSTHFYSSGNTFIKGSPDQPGPTSKSNLKYISADSSDYFGKYELESNHGWNDLVELCDIVTNQPSALSSSLDIDRVIWMLAFNNVLVSLDSYSGWFSQNHYVYKDDSGIYDPVIWDLNMSFGGFPFAGTQNGGSGSLTVDDMKQLTPLLHSTHTDWPLIYNILGQSSWQKMYYAHMRTIIQEHFANGSYLETAQMMQDLVNVTVQNDPNKFFTYQQFQQGLTSDFTFGTYTVPGIQNLMDSRAAYLMSTSGLTTVPPVISGITPVPAQPEFNTTVTIRATVNEMGGSGTVMLGLRFEQSDHFVTQQMFDDGNHNDGSAGDNIFGSSFTMSAPMAQYYIYAENAQAAAFSPAHAEHEFYSLSAIIPTAGPGDVVINEFLAKNTADTTNEFGNYEDWIEFYNMTSEPVDLFGLFLTDDYTDPVKYTFPVNTIIDPHGFFIVWADEEDTVSEYLHVNFKLSASGEAIMLSNGLGVVLDSLTFGEQTADVSLGRCPNGVGTFSTLDIPTFGYENYCPEFIQDHAGNLLKFTIAPNPFRDQFVISSNDIKVFSAELFNSSGMKIDKKTGENGQIRYSDSVLPKGIYFILVKNEKNEVIGSGKVIKLN